MPNELRVADAMSFSPKIVSKNESVRDASKKLINWGVGSLLVIEGDTLIGILTKTDIIKRIMKEDAGASKIRVGDIMTTKIISTTPSTYLSKAAGLMVKHDLRRLPVIENDKFIGLITQTDILRVQPSTLDLLAEKFISSSSFDVRQMDNVRGVCDGCADASLLKLYEGSMLCQNCLGGVQ